MNRTVKKSPCYECKLHHQGINKSSEECVKCDKRIEYSRSISSDSGYGAEIQKNGKSDINRKCRECKRYFPETKDYFTTHYSGSFLSICKKCQAQKISDGLKGKAGSKSVNPTDRVKNNPPTQNNSNIIILDFSGYKSLLTNIKDRAVVEFRSTENQIFYCINKYLDK